MEFLKKLSSIFSFKKPQPQSKRKVSSRLHEGVVRHFNHSRGFGFIYSKKFDQKIFVHISDLESKPKIGQKVTFDVEETTKGLRAINVKRAIS